MMGRLSITTLFLVFGICVFSGVAQAECTARSSRVLLADEVDNASMVTDKPCGIVMTGEELVRMENMAVVRAPTNGRAGIFNQFSIGYIPKPGYKGSDLFVVKVCGIRLTAKGCSTIQFHVTVF